MGRFRLPFTWRSLAGLALTLAIASAGGYLFAAVKLPLPWMLGAMTSVTLATLLRLPVTAPPAIRPPMTAIIGVLLGTSFHPGLIASLPGWLPTFAGLVLFSAVSGLACAAYLHRVAGFDRVTAFFAGMPGGLVEMIELGSERGGDELRITLIHSARILLVVLSLPFLVQLIEGVSLGSRPAVGRSITEAELADFALLAGCAVLGSLLGKRLRLPAAYLLGPMLLSAAPHAAGLTTFAPPRELVMGAQIVLGSVLGCRFVAAQPAEILRILLIAFGMTLVLLAVVTLCAWGVATLTGESMVSLILAYSPGGLAEMSLVAIAIHADVAFVAAHHLARILIVMTGAAPAYALLGRLLDRRTATAASDPAE